MRQAATLPYPTCLFCFFRSFRSSDVDLSVAAVHSSPSKRSSSWSLQLRSAVLPACKQRRRHHGSECTEPCKHRHASMHMLLL